MTGSLLLALSFSVLQAQAQDAEPRVRVDPAAVELEVDGTVTLRATIENAPASGMDAPLRWFSTSPDVASVDEEGRVTALRPGTARVAAGLVQQGLVGYAEISVAALPPSELTVTAPATTVAARTWIPLHVTGHNRLGDPTEGFRVSFASSDPTVLSVDDGGRVLGVAPGQATVTATSGTARATLTVDVTDPLVAVPQLTSSRPSDTEVRTGDVVRFRARAGGAALHPAWSVSGAGAQIEAEGAEGVFVAEEPGSYRVTAAVGPSTVLSETVVVEPRVSDVELVQVGRGGIGDHHSGDMWVFEGVDGRDYVYVGTFMHDWMKIWDVTDAGAPTLTDSIQMDARRINDVKIHPTRPVGIVTREGASSRRNGIVLLDLSTPAHPSILSEYTETVTGGVHNVWIDEENDLVYACHNGTSDVHILDISDPANVAEVGRWGLPESPTKTLHDIIVQDGYAFLSYWDDGVVILDVGAGSHGGTPREPAFVSRYAYPIGNTHVAWRAGDYLFLGDEIFPDDWQADGPIEARGYIHVVDVSDIENPHEVAFYEVPEAGAHNVWVEGDRLYVGYYQAGLRVVDISGELRGDLYAQGRELAAFKTTDETTTVPNWPMAWGAQIHKGNIYSSDLNSGIWITRLQPKGRVVF